MTNPVSLRRHLPARRPAHTEAVPTPAAERQRHYRERLRQAARCMRGDVSADVVRALVINGWVSRDEADDPQKLGAALVDLADCWMRETLEPPKS